MNLFSRSLTRTWWAWFHTQELRFLWLTMTAAVGSPSKRWNVDGDLHALPLKSRQARGQTHKWWCWEGCWSTGTREQWTGFILPRVTACPCRQKTQSFLVLLLKLNRSAVNGNDLVPWGRQKSELPCCLICNWRRHASLTSVLLQAVHNTWQKLQQNSSKWYTVRKASYEKVTHFTESWNVFRCWSLNEPPIWYKWTEGSRW